MSYEGQGESWATKCLIVSSTEMGNVGEGKDNFTFGYIEFEVHVQIPVESVH